MGEKAEVEFREPSGNGEVILLVEDDPAYRTRLTQMLSEAGYVPRLAANANEALATLESARVRLVLSDILIPNESGEADPEAGFKLVAKLRKDRAGIPVALLTGWSIEEYIQCALKYDVGNVLSKSANRAEILKCVHMWITGEGVFGLKNYIPPGEKIVSREFRTSVQARLLCNEVAETLVFMGFSDVSRRRAKTMVDEITENAIMHSSNDYKSLLDVPKKLAAEMKSARIEYGGPPTRFGVAITDYMGRLTKKRVLKCLANVVLERKGDYKEDKPAVTGRGIYITRALAKEYYINIKRSEMTEVILIANNQAAALDVNQCSLKINEL